MRCSIKEKSKDITYIKIYIKKSWNIWPIYGLYGCELYGHKTPMWEPEDINYNMPGSSPCMATLKDNRENWKKMISFWFLYMQCLYDHDIGICVCVWIMSNIQKCSWSGKLEISGLIHQLANILYLYSYHHFSSSK